MSFAVPGTGGQVWTENLILDEKRREMLQLSRLLTRQMPFKKSLFNLTCLPADPSALYLTRDSSGPDLF